MAARERNIFRDELDEIQKQINRMVERVNYSINCVQTCQATIDGIADRVSKMEQEDDATNARYIPDSEGFWRDDDGDVWVCDAEGSTLLIAKGHKEGAREIYDLPRCNDGALQECGPYVKIYNPFIQGEDHAE